MTLFSRTDFDDAIQLPASRLKVDDCDLHNGRVEMVVIQTSAGQLSFPNARQGGFAVVFKFRKASGKIVALRCLMRQPGSGFSQRLSAIDTYFRLAARGFTAPFRLPEGGLVVRNAGGSSTIFPVIEMEWLEAPDLDQKVDSLCRIGDSEGLGKLADSWRHLFIQMQTACVAHGDLSGGNVKVLPNGCLVLIDYDGVFVPELTGMDPLQYGQPEFQHRDMIHRPFDEHMDDFAALSIFTALIGLREKPALWQEYAQLNYQGKLVSSGILFEAEDYRNPGQSKMFGKLKAINNAEVQRAVNALEEACQMRTVSEVRVPPWFVAPGRAA